MQGTDGAGLAAPPVVLPDFCHKAKSEMPSSIAVATTGEIRPALADAALNCGMALMTLDIERPSASAVTDFYRQVAERFPSPPNWRRELTAKRGAAGRHGGRGFRRRAVRPQRGRTGPHRRARPTRHRRLRRRPARRQGTAVAGRADEPSALRRHRAEHPFPRAAGGRGDPRSRRGGGTRHPPRPGDRPVPQRRRRPDRPARRAIRPAQERVAHAPHRRWRYRSRSPTC